MSIQESHSDKGEFVPLSGREKLAEIAVEVTKFLSAMDSQHGQRGSLRPGETVSSFWTPKEKQQSERFAAQIRLSVAEIASGAARSVLFDDVDRKRLRTNAKTMEAAVRGWSYQYREKYFEEGFGFQPAEEALDYLFSADMALVQFNRALKDTFELLDLAGSEAFGADPQARSEVTGFSAAPSYRKNTAFLIMWITKELDDLVDAVKEVFGSFGIRALRADDIEHEGVITSRVLEEIAHSEFLFADLTGGRPNVYYEVGYAHALGKRVILYRKTGTQIHFDIAHRNCPEYENLRDLKSKLTRRLEGMTG